MMKCILWLVVYGEGKIYSTLKIIPAIVLPRFERRPSGQSFAYSRFDVLFLIRSNMAIDLLEKFQAKI